MILGWASFWLASVFWGQTEVMWNVEIGGKTSVHQLKYLSSVPPGLPFLSSRRKSGKNNYCPLLRTYYMLGTLFSSSAMLTATLWGGYYLPPLCYRWEDEDLEMPRARPYSQEMTEVEVWADIMWPKAGGFSVPKLCLLLFDHSVSLSSRFFISSFVLDLEAAFLLLTYLISDLYLSWKASLNWAEFQIWKTHS